MTHLDPTAVQVLAAILFALGLGCAASRRNIFFLLMGVELMLNAVNLSFIGFARTFPDDSGMAGHLSPLFIIAIAAAEVAVGLAIILALYRGKATVNVEDLNMMKW
jgi:NADH:ubiquinone oxidoreductase subunit K